MWSKNPRNLLEAETRWIRRLGGHWPTGYLRDVRVVEFSTDHAHTIRNAALVRRRVRSVSSQLARDEDGASVDVILYEAEMGEFGELEFIRLDTRPLLAIPG